MPLYRTNDDGLDALVQDLERAGETLVQIERVPGGQGRPPEFLVLTNMPVNDTGFAWAPDRMRGGA
jgi:hypothetical protein